MTWRCWSLDIMDVMWCDLVLELLAICLCRGPLLLEKHYIEHVYKSIKEWLSEVTYFLGRFSILFSFQDLLCNSLA